MDFASLVSLKIEEQNALQQKFEQEKIARQERERQDLITKLQEELSHILDLKWVVQPVTHKVAIAYCDISLDSNEGNKKFRVFLKRDCERQGYYIPGVEKFVESGETIIISQSVAQKASDISKDGLAAFAAERIRFYLKDK